MNMSTDFLTLYNDLDDESKGFLLAAGRALAARRSPPKKRAPILTLVSTRLLKPVKDSISNSIESIEGNLVGQPEGR